MKPGKCCAKSNERTLIGWLEPSGAIQQRGLSKNLKVSTLDIHIEPFVFSNFFLFFPPDIMSC